MTTPAPPQTTARAPRVRDAVIRDLHDAQQPLRLRDMTSARAIATDVRDLHVVLQRMLRAGQLRRIGLGYHLGDPFMYDLGPSAPPRT